ncbi:MAG: enoyl-CoA hydratase/isomerase family protein [Burkholderiales bacterium]|nr:enoyl-CoA hydratase/isomerase family protein [Burkholderiales bacterium]
MTPEHLKLSVDDHVATLVLDRPPVNALGRAIREELLAAFDELHDRDDVRVVVLTGAGRTFCAGADIKERAKLTGRPGEYRELNRLVREVFHGVIQCSKPVIAAVNGAALGAGFALALCCDMVLASEDAVFGMPEVDVGLAGGVKFLQRYFTPSQARMLLITGRRVPAAELYRLGVLQACVPAQALMPEARKLAAEIAAKSPLAVRMLKQSFNVVENLSLGDGYRIEQDMTIELSKSEDAQEAKRAFVEKRKPAFKGR